MPGFTTHYIFGMKAYNDLPNNQLKRIIAKYRWLYQLGLQGPDMFFYYIPVLRHRDYRNVGSYMHEHHINEFFRCSLNRLSRLQSRQQREQAAAYGHSERREFAFLIVHSMLHLFGYDHMTPEDAAVMEPKQRQILEEMNISRD